ncbi:hypothetical protein [Anaerococcus lactolyticus]|nr:hypothetical protein [Anaerococcus lactolyticus]
MKLIELIKSKKQANEMLRKEIIKESDKWKEIRKQNRNDKE